MERNEILWVLAVSHSCLWATENLFMAETCEIVVITKPSELSVRCSSIPCWELSLLTLGNESSAVKGRYETLKLSNFFHFIPSLSVREPGPTHTHSSSPKEHFIVMSVFTLPLMCSGCKSFEKLSPFMILSWICLWELADIGCIDLLFDHLILLYHRCESW